MHHIYHTRGIILGSKHIGESNRLFFVFTKDLGLVVAVAQGVRELKSKLRFSLQDFNISAVSLVRGKDIWRVTSAEHENGYQNIMKDPKKRMLVARICGLLRRLVHGEEKNEELFTTATNLFIFLEQNEPAKEELWRLELIANLQILSALGYESPNPALQPFMHTPFSHEILGQMEGCERTAVKEINTILKETQL